MRSKKLSILFLALVLSSGVIAGLPQLQDDEGSIDKNSGSGNGAVAPRAPVVVVEVDKGAVEVVAQKGEECKKADNSISLLTLKSVTKGGKSISVSPTEKVIEKNGKKVTVKDYDNLRVDVPSHVQKCLNLSVSARKVGKDVVIGFTNLYDFQPASAYKGLSGDAKLEKCLSEDVEDANGTKVTTKVIVNNKFIPNLSNAPITRTVHVSKVNNENFDISQDINIYVASDRELTHVNAYDQNSVQPEGGSTCFAYEHPIAKGMKLIDRTGLYAYKNMDDCDGQCGAKISEAMGELQMQNIGNGNALYDILVDARNKLLDADTKRKEKKLEEIAKELAGTTDEQKVREKLREYVSVLSDYENFPQKQRLDELRLLYSKLDKGEGNKDEIQKRIKELKTAIGEISKTKYGADVAKKKAEELGLKDDGVFIVKMKLTSAYYSDMQNLGKTVSLNPDQAQTKLDKEMTLYEERARELLEIYESKNGLADHSNKYSKQGYRIMSERDKAWERYRETEAGYAKACQPKAFNFTMNGQQNMTNPQKCMRGHQSRQQRYARVMRGTNQIEKRANRKFKIAEVLGQHEEENRRRVASENESANGDIMDNSTVFDYADEFSGDDGGMNMFQMNGQQFSNPMMQPYGMNQGYQQPYQQQQMAYPGMQYNMPMR
jgi:hypothetical protein